MLLSGCPQWALAGGGGPGEGVWPSELPAAKAPARLVREDDGAAWSHLDEEGGVSRGLFPPGEQSPQGARLCPGRPPLFVWVDTGSVGAQVTWQEAQLAWRAGPELGLP